MNRNHIRLRMGVRSQNRPKPDSCTELCAVNAADIWRERNVWHSGRSRQWQKQSKNKWTMRLCIAGQNRRKNIPSCKGRITDSTSAVWCCTLKKTKIVYCKDKDRAK